MKEENWLFDIRFRFAVRIVNIYRFLINEKKEFVLSKQLLRSGTSNGANVEEANAGQSRADFIAKLSISYNEAKETHYWIRLMRETKILSTKESESLLTDLQEKSIFCKKTRKLRKAIFKNNESYECYENYQDYFIIFISFTIFIIKRVCM